MAYQITGHTRLGCLLGTPVSHSISPMMHNEAFRILGLDCVYLCFDTKNADLKTMVQTLKEMNVYGFNLTMPDKERILPYLDELSPAARMIGAVNTVKNEDGRLIGHNTDGIGYMQSVKDTGYDATTGPMTLLGAGGAASSIAIQAALDGVPVLHIVNRRGRSWDNALRLADLINENTSCKADVTDMAKGVAVKACIKDSLLLTNATSIGMAPNTDASPVQDTSCFHPDLLVSDIIYNPRRTKLLLEAQDAGCRISNGMYMLLYQGAAAFQIWTGKEMPVEEIRQKFFQ
ncbi:MAG: shikimate dehydrogenase [Lachnospiraceae bacterium]|nr:shikimate dehydrogenase [Lachnospiraceae bacterium]MDD7079080.1 shikimate dehydrogenase [Lachnospiraceae bacterium]MDY3730194.1 shikimate dehydrogenase [Candidatus Choladocola sp.]